MSDIIEEFLKDFLNAGMNQGIACDDAYETGFATLTDKEGHPYVAHLDGGTGKEGKKDEKKGEKKPESEQDLTKAETSDYDKMQENRRKENPLTEKMKNAVADINKKVTEKLTEFYRKAEKLRKDFKEKHKDILDKFHNMENLSVSELKDLYRKATDLSTANHKFNEEIDKFKDESFGEFLKTVQAKSKNSKNLGRIAHYLSDIKEKSPLGKLAFRKYEYVPSGIRNNIENTGFDITSNIMHEIQKRQRSMATDSIEYKELTEFMNQYGIKTDTTLDKYLDNVNLF